MLKISLNDVWFSISEGESTLNVLLLDIYLSILIFVDNCSRNEHQGFRWIIIER